MEERYFYHCFPRKGVKDTALGLRTLSLIAEHGLLLTPELISWTDPTSNIKYQQLQRRACFTQLPRTELGDHCDKFGHFAIQFSYDGLRSIGGIPVFYLPEGPMTVSGLDGIGAAFACRIFILRSCIEHLLSLKSAAGGNAASSIVLNQNVVCPTSVLNAFFQSLPVHNSSLEELRFAVDMVQNLLLPAENRDHTGPLEYYRQREWRIPENYAYKNELLAKPLEPTLREELLSLVPEFFGKEITHPSGEKRLRVDWSLCFRHLGAKRILEFASAVFVPQETLAEAEKILRTNGHQMKIDAIEAYFC